MGIKKGHRLTTKKSVLMKKQILQLSKDFNGSLPETELMKELGIARNTYYKYKHELRTITALSVLDAISINAV